ncbi:hypothetical protein CXU01_01795 [Akkermansia muciniphila]|nr:hypothetical protein CXU01_01795 [Akkermansia muciniphila]
MQEIVEISLLADLSQTRKNSLPFHESGKNMELESASFLDKSMEVKRFILSSSHDCPSEPTGNEKGESGILPGGGTNYPVPSQKPSPYFS